MQKRNSVEANMKNCASFPPSADDKWGTGTKAAFRVFRKTVQQTRLHLIFIKGHYGNCYEKQTCTLNFQVLVKIVENRRPPLPKPFLAPPPRPSLRFLMIRSLGISRDGCLCGMCSFSRALQEALNKHAASMWFKNAWQIKHGTSSARSPSSSNHGCTQDL